MLEKTSAGKSQLSKSKDDLLKQLSKQHRDLNKQQKIIEKTRLVSTQDFKETLSLINKFKKDFEAHILLERVDFYNYLEKVFADQTSRVETLKQSRQDLNPIINSVLRYCNRYNSAEKIRKGKKSFHKDARDIRRLVKKRSRFEERKLFPIYAKLS